ncbi:MAG TPA: tetratricopeptide repeat protein [bacterium]|nr:tetratricopeptide repeat protein [bacterium]
MSDHRRLTKKQLKQDRFLEAVFTAWNYARDNVAIVIGGTLVLIALIALGVRVGSTVSGAPRGNPEAERALSSARMQFLSGQPDAATVALEDVRKKYGGSTVGREATLLLANSLYESGQFAQALPVFQDYLKKPLHDDLTRDHARIAIAACQEETGDIAGAVQTYEGIWSDAQNPALRVQAAMAAARCSETQGQTDRAISLYRAVADDYADSPEAEAARFRLLELQSPS